MHMYVCVKQYKVFPSLIIPVVIRFIFSSIHSVLFCFVNGFGYTTFIWKKAWDLMLNMLNLLNGLVLLPFLELSIIYFRDIKMRFHSWLNNSIEPDQTARMCSLAWLYTCGKGLSLLVRWSSYQINVSHAKAMPLSQRSKSQWCLNMPYMDTMAVDDTFWSISLSCTVRF